MRSAHLCLKIDAFSHRCNSPHSFSESGATQPISISSPQGAQIVVRGKTSTRHRLFSCCVTKHAAGHLHRQNARPSSRAMGIRDKPIAASPWQNSFVERLIGSIRRECLDHVIVLGEAHLRRILKNYADYYNGVRTHRSLNKDAPISRPVRRSGFISSDALLGGLHHRYARV